MASVTRAFVITFSSRILGLMVGIGTQVCLARILGPDDRGSYAVCLMFATLLNVFCTIGCDVASTYFVAAKRFNISEGVLYAIIYGGFFSVMAIVIGLIIMQFPLTFFQKANPTSFYFALATIPILVFFSTFTRLLTALDEFGQHAIMNIVHSSILFLCTIIFVWGLSWGVEGAFLAIMIGGVVTVTLTFIFIRKRYRIKWTRPRLGRLFEMFHYGIRYYFGKISNQMNFQMGTIILAFFATKDQIAFFAVASQVTDRLMIIPNTLITILIPKVAGDEEGRKHLIAQCSRLTGLVTGVQLLVLVIFARPIVNLLFGSEYLAVAVLLQIMAIGMLIRSTCKVFVPYLLGTNHPGISSISVAVGAVVYSRFTCSISNCSGITHLIS